MQGLRRKESTLDSVLRVVLLTESECLMPERVYYTGHGIPRCENGCELGGPVRQ